MHFRFGLSILFLTVTVIFTDCSITTTKRKPPQFATDLKLLSDTLNHLVCCEHINLDGKEITTNGKSTSEMDVDILNPVNLPASQNEQDQLTRQIAIQIKQALRNQNDYNTYKVLFVTEHSSGAVTTTNSSGHVWNSNELN